MARKYIEEMKEKRDIDGLIELAEEGEDKERAEAVKALGLIADNDVLSVLIKRLDDEEKTVRANAVIAISHIDGKQVKDKIIDMVHDDAWEVRHDTAIAMGEMRDEEFIGPLKGLVEDEELEVKQKAIEALGEIGDNEVIPFLEEHMDDIELEEDIAKAISNIGTEEALEPLTEMFKEGDRWVRETAVQGLSKIDSSEATKVILEGLKDTSWRVREDSALALGEKGDKDAVKPLLQLLDDDKKYVVEAALKSLGKLGDEEIIEKVSHKLDDDDPSIRSAAAQTLGEVNTEGSLNLIIQHIDFEENPRVLWSISEGVSKFPKDELENIENKVKRYEGHKKIILSVALGKAGFSSMAPTLLDYIDDDRWKIRQKVIEALKKIDVNDLSKTQTDKAFRKLTERIEDNDKWVRTQAVLTLGNYIFDVNDDIETEEAKKALVQRMKVESDEDVKESFKEVKYLLDL
ncbi:MAG: HEAT repeat domain-containing protein [Thermoplasmatota archaeon]